MWRGSAKGSDMTSIPADGHDWEAEEADVLEQSQSIDEPSGLPEDASIADDKPEADVIEQLLPGAGADEDDYEADEDRPY